MDKFIKKSMARLVVIIITIVSIFMLFQMKSVVLETDLDQYMPKNHPKFIYSDKMEDLFDIKDGIIIAIESEKGIYNSVTLQKIKDLTKALGKMTEIQKSDVTSLYTADNIIGTKQGLDVKAFYKRVPTSSEELTRLQKNVRDNDMVFGRLVSKDEKVTIIVAEIKDNVFTQEFYKKILVMVESFEKPEKFYVAGSPIVEGTLASLMPRDMKKMVPMVLLVIIVVLFFLLKSFRSTIFTLLVVILSSVWTFGLMGIFNIPIYAVSTMIPVMLIAIGVADGIHLYSHLDLFLANNPGSSRAVAVKDMLKGMWKPVVMTSLTTAVGFVSLLTSQVYPIKYFGLFTAFGVIMAMFFSLFLIPSMILLFGFTKRKPVVAKDSIGKLFSHKFALGVVRHKGSIFLGTIAVVIISLWGISKVWINSSFLDKFEKDSKIVLTDKFINDNFGGTSTLNVILQAEENDIIKSPLALKWMDQLQKKVDSSLAIVGNSFSLADYIKRMNMVMNQNKEEFDVIPESKELIAQYLLLYEISGDPENLWKVVDYDYKTANITFQLKSDNSKAINSAIFEIEKFKDEFKKLGIDLNFAGSGYKALIFADLILQGQIKSLIICLFIIIFLLAFMFKNFWVGIIGSVPIVITAFIGFGILGILNIPLSTTTALISSIAIGMGIDYAVHFIESYKINAKNTGDKNLTTFKTMHDSGRAIIFNAIVVIAGFMVLLFSIFPPNRVLGAMVSLNMLSSFLGTLTVMFLIIYKSNLFFQKSQKYSVLKGEAQ